MKILITGSAGYLGNYLCHYLNTKHEIIGLDLSPIRKTISFKNKHIDLRKYVPDKKFDLIIHLASRVGGFLFNQQKELMNYEMELGEHVIDIAQKSDCPNIIYTSSINVFENSQNYIHAELENTILPSTPYALGKRHTEKLFSEHFQNLTVIRPTNLFGYYDFKNFKETSIGYSHVIPDLCYKILNPDIPHLDILGDGLQIRNFLHIQDVLRFIDLNLNVTGKNYINLRSDIFLNILNVADHLCQWLNQKKQFIFHPEYLKQEPLPIQKFAMEDIYQNYKWRPIINDFMSGLLINN